MKHSSFLLSCSLLFSSSLFCMDTVEMDEGAGAPLIQNEFGSEAEDPLAENPTPDRNDELLQVDLATILEIASNKFGGIPIVINGLSAGLVGWYNTDFYNNNKNSEIVAIDPSEYRSLIYTHAPLAILCLINCCSYSPKVKKPLYQKVYEKAMDIMLYGAAVQQLIIGDKMASSEISVQQYNSNVALVFASGAFCIKGALDLARIGTCLINRRNRRSQSDIESSQN